MKVITTVVGELGTNCYLLIDEATREAALIDPADSPDELSALIEREGVTLRYILLTHGHRDHTLAVPAVKQAIPEAEVYIGEADAHSTGIYHYPMADFIPDLKFYGEGDTLTLGVGREGEPYEGIGRGMLNIAGLPVYRDNTGGVGTPTSDNERTKMGLQTRHLVALVNGYDGNEDTVRATAELIINLVNRFCKGQNARYFVYR